MSAAPYTRRIPKKFHKTITFTGAANLGAVGTVPVGTVVGSVLLMYGGVRCTTNLTSAGGGTLSLGTAGNVDGVIELTTATDIDANDIWQDATPEVKVSPAIVNLVVADSLILTVATGDVTAGVLEFDFYYLPLSADGSLS